MTILEENTAHRKFPKIPRFNRDIIITEKIDGTNAQILITEDRQIFAGSRHRWLTLDNDNHGFAAWVEEHREELIIGLGPGRHYGEWWGCRINRGYGLDHKRFSLFNVSRWEQTTISYPIPQYPGAPPILPSAPECCYVVPILRGPNSFDTLSITATLRRLEVFGSIAAPGFMKPEGIVIYHTAGNCLFKITCENDDQWKGDDGR